MEIDINKYPTTNAIGDYVRQLMGVEHKLLATVIDYSMAALGLVIFVSITALFLVYAERKVCAHFQARLGPMRVGYHGILQALADGVKLFFKEGLRPKDSDAVVFYLAPMIPMMATFLILSILPFDHHLQVTDLDGGILFVIAISGFSTFGLLTAGWASNNKYSMIGSMRAAAQMISYEISVALSLLLVVLLSGETSLMKIVYSQQGTVADWWIFKAPVAGFLGAVVFTISSIAETNRGPFDMAEAESELTAGFHTEYSGITFSMFFLAEFMAMFIASALVATCFLGGFLAPQFGVDALDSLLILVPGFVWFLIKAYAVIFVFMWIRWTFPRLRVDQLMAFEWKFLLPVALLNLVFGAVLVAMGWIL